MCVPSIAPTIYGNPQHVSKLVMTSRSRSPVEKHIPREEMCCYCVSGFNDYGADGGASYAEQLG